ncbi:protein containing DUF1501 [Rhodopirellula baltica SWK14]|uniref:Protein containing DUF1501 n=1 Tax=Rhodopirellula baltica SWK14 TaxID=993516 RepID=L7CQ96_RHOBT|nr:protein containing DUF1501 [Rhodopirellula baltica SWK14]
MTGLSTFGHPSISRRQMLAQTSMGFGGVALAALMNEAAADHAGHGVHHPAKAKNVIFLYMDGGPSQIDTFDPKPLLTKMDGREPGDLFRVEPTQFNNNGKVLGSPWKFKQHGESGIPVSSLFPHVAGCVDELAVVRSMVSEFSEHTFANYFFAHRKWIAGTSKHGCLGQLRFGVGVQQPSRVCGLERRFDSSRWTGLFWQRFPAGHLPGIRLSATRHRGCQHQVA